MLFGIVPYAVCYFAFASEKYLTFMSLALLGFYANRLCAMCVTWPSLQAILDLCVICVTWAIRVFFHMCYLASVPFRDTWPLCNNIMCLLLSLCAILNTWPLCQMCYWLLCCICYLSFVSCQIYLTNVLYGFYVIQLHVAYLVSVSYTWTVLLCISKKSDKRLHLFS